MYERFDWEALAEEISEHPDEEVLVPQMTQTDRCRSLVQSVNYGQAKPLRDLGGVVYAYLRNSEAIQDGRIGDVWVKWDPTGDPVGRYAPRYLAQDTGRATP